MQLSAVAIMNELKSEVRAERRSSAKIVRYLAAIDSKRLYLQLGFSSLYELATRELGYSSSAAMRRIKAARVVNADPSVIAKLESGELNFSTVDVLANFVNEPVLKDLTQQFCGRSREDAEKIVAQLRPVAKTAVRDRVVPVVVASTERQKASPLFENTEQNSKYCRTNAQPELRKCEEFGERPEERFHISFAASKEVKEKLDRARQLLFKGDPSAVAFEKVIDKALTLLLSLHCPKERQKRREERTARRAAKAEVPTEKVAQSTTSPRQIPVTVRDRVLERDEYQCSFVSKAGGRCACKVDLEIDHIVPLGRGGSSEESNLRTLCRAHNLGAARDTFGEEYITHRIAARERVVATCP